MIECKVKNKCGGCQYQGMDYTKQLAMKEQYIGKLLSPFGKIGHIIGMEDPYHYRNKVHHVFHFDRKTGIISGCYQEGTHRVVDVEDCLIEDVESQQIILTVKKLCRSFKLKAYDEDTGYGWLRHCLVRRGFATGEIMVVLVAADPIFPGKNNFIKALLKEHPKIKTVVLNINDKKTSMVLGEREIILFGQGFIRDRLCGCSFRISSKSFYQVNPVQTELLYRTALDFAGLRKTDVILDAYCGIGTIGLAAAGRVKSVTGIELNKDAVRDAVINAKENGIKNAVFRTGDSGKLMTAMTENGVQFDCVFMDPPRSGSTEQFMSACVKASPERIVYVSCGPDTLARDLRFFTKHGYRVSRIQPVDMFPFTEHVEACVLLTRTSEA